MNPNATASPFNTIRITHPFVVWWSAVSQSILRLIRQRSLKSDILHPPNLGQDLTTTEIYHHPHAEDVNDLAAGLDAVQLDTPTLDQTPLE